MDYRGHKAPRGTATIKQQAIIASNVVIEWNGGQTAFSSGAEQSRINPSSRLLRSESTSSASAHKVPSKEDPRNVHSVVFNSGKTSHQYKSNSFSAGHHMIFSENPSAPGIPLVYRTPEDRSANPERLNLDRRRLSVCPILEGEERLRVLSLQHNSIRTMEHLSGLRRLVFLDFYDNQLREIAGLETLSSLRVLMLGKNKIQQITGLDSLVKLDVLDLHGNMIQVIENLLHLRHLRVLNLAGNEIVYTTGLTGMVSLTELNLRRNRITHVCEIDALPQLQRLYLSHNLIKEFSDVSCLANCQCLSDLSLDGTPLANNMDYRRAVIYCVARLRVLDSKPLSEEEKLQAQQLVQEEEELQQIAREEARMSEQRLSTINRVIKEWKSSTYTTAKPRGTNQKPTKHASISHAYPPPSISYVEEVDRTLHLYGCASLDMLASPPITWQPQQVTFHYIDYDDITPHLARLGSRYQQLKTLSFHCCNLKWLDQLDTMVTAVPSLDALEVSSDGNPITSLSLWQYYAIAKLKVLKLNGETVTCEQVTLSNKLFGKIFVEHPPKCIHQQTDKGRLTATREVCSQLLKQALSHEEKQKTFEALWPEMLRHIVSSIVGDLGDAENKEYHKL